MAVTFTVLDKTGMVDLENPSVMWRCIEIVADLIPYLVIGYDKMCIRDRLNVKIRDHLGNVIGKVFAASIPILCRCV